MYVATLRGTDKQRRWAESIRMRVIHAAGYKQSTFPDIEYRLAYLNAIPDASWWIRQKDTPPDALVRDLEMKPIRLRPYKLNTPAGVSAWSRGIYNTVILDTETTGKNKNDDDEIIEVAVIDLEGQTLMNTLVRPTIPIPADATEKNHITDEMVRNAPTFSQIWPGLRALLCLYRVVVYNAAFDMRLIRRLAGEAMHTCSGVRADCAMIAYATYRHEEDQARGGHKWHKLGAACEYFGVQITGNAHRALADCLMTLGVIRGMREACEQAEEYEWMMEEPAYDPTQDELPGLMVEEPAPHLELPMLWHDDQELVNRLVAYVERRVADNPGGTFYAKGAWDAYGKTLDGPGYLAWFNELLRSSEIEKQHWAREEIARRLR